MDKLEHETTGTSAVTADHPTPKNRQTARRRALRPRGVLPRRRHRPV